MGTSTSALSDVSSPIPAFDLALASSNPTLCIGEERHVQGSGNMQSAGTCWRNLVTIPEDRGATEVSATGDISVGESADLSVLPSKNLVRVTLKPVKPKTEALYDSVLHEWELCVYPEKRFATNPDLTRSSFTQDISRRYPRCAPNPLDPEIAKKFLLFYKSGRRGRISAGHSITNSSTETVWKYFIMT